MRASSQKAKAYMSISKWDSKFSNRRTLVRSFLDLRPFNKLPLGSRESCVSGIPIFKGGCGMQKVNMAFDSSQRVRSINAEVKALANNVMWKGFENDGSDAFETLQTSLAKCKVQVHAVL